jgi:glycosyltransferase involved in cell wall biosynthesis
MVAPAANAEDGGDRLAAERSQLAIILTGTDPERIEGGIGTAVAGYKNALIQRGLLGGLIPTYRAGSMSGKWWPWLKALPALRRGVRSLRRQGKGVVVYGHAGPRASLLRESLALLWARLCGARTMLQLHTPHMDRYMDKPVVRMLLRLAFLPVDRVSVLSPWWQRRLSEGGFTGTVVIPNQLSADLEAVARGALEPRGARPPAGAPKRELVILAMARLTRGKCVHIAVEALKHLPEHVVLRVAGDGPELEPLRALAHDLGVSGRVRFLGWVSDADKHRQLEEADAFCAPSRADAFSMSMIEALCYGLPVVTVRSRAIADLVEDGETGFVVQVNDAEAVAGAIMRLDEPSVRARMGTAAARWALINLSGEVVGAKIGTAANGVLSGAA